MTLTREQTGPVKQSSRGARNAVSGAEDVSLFGRNRTDAGPPGADPGSPPVPEGNVQSGVLPWRTGDNGEVEILLITSRGGNRWIIPKGWPMPGMSLAESARQEAFEEAGIRGSPTARPIGKILTDKTDLLGRTRQLEVLVYAMEVTDELADWPEKAERQRRWCSPAEAIELVDAPSLRELIQSFAKAGKGA